VGVGYAHAVPESPHVGRVADLPSDLFDHEMSPRVISCEDAFERGHVISLSAAPWDVTQVETVVNSEILERRKVFLVDGIPQP
jgi:hypothetical protein